MAGVMYTDETADADFAAYTYYIIGPLLFLDQRLHIIIIIVISDRAYGDMLPFRCRL